MRRKLSENDPRRAVAVEMRRKGHGLRFIRDKLRVKGAILNEWLRDAVPEMEIEQARRELRLSRNAQARENARPASTSRSGAITPPPYARGYRYFNTSW